MNPISNRLCVSIRDSVLDIVSSAKIPKNYNKSFIDSRALEDLCSVRKSDLAFEIVVRSNNTPELMFSILELGNDDDIFVGKSWISLGGTRMAQRQIYDLSSSVLGASDENGNFIVGKLGLSNEDYVRIGDEVVAESYNLIRQYYPKLYKSMLSMNIVADLSCETLYVTFKKDIGKVELHYNPGFVANGALTELVSSMIESDAGAISSLTNDDINNFVISLGTFYFMHEVYHVIYKHLESSSSPIPQHLENFTQDAYINTMLADVYINNPVLVQVWDKLKKTSMTLYTGISSQYSITGSLHEAVINIMKSYQDKSDFVKDFDSALSDARWKIQIPTSNGGITSITSYIVSFPAYHDKVSYTSNDLEGKFTVFVNHLNSPLDRSYDEYSQSAMNLIATIIDTHGSNTKGKTMTPPSGKSPDNNNQKQQGQSSQQSQQGQGQQGGSSSQGQQNSQPSQGDDLDDLGDLDSQGQGNQQSNDGKGGKGQGGGKPQGQTSDIGDGFGDLMDDDNEPSNTPSKTDSLKGMSEKIDKAFDNAREEAIEKLSNKTDKRSKEISKNITSKISEVKTRRIADELQTQILSTMNKNSGNIGDWRKILKSILEDVTGITIKYDADAPNARIQGQFGREIIETKLRDIIFSFDISASMEVKDFKKAVEYVSSMMSIGLPFERCGFIYWTSKYKEVIPRRLPARQVYTKAVAECPDFRSATPIAQAIEPFITGKMRSAKPDVVVIFTDGDFQMNGFDSKHQAWIRKNRKKIVWVLKKGGTTRDILQIDPGSQKRIVKMR